MFMQLILENLSFQNDNKELEKLVLVNRIKESKTNEEKMRGELWKLWREEKSERKRKYLDIKQIMTNILLKINNFIENCVSIKRR